MLPALIVTITVTRQQPCVESVENWFEFHPEEYTGRKTYRDAVIKSMQQKLEHLVYAMQNGPDSL